MENKYIVIIAGEISGDQHAALLVSALKKIDPLLSFSGLGGEKMKSAGVELYRELTQYAAVGFWEVIKNYSFYRKVFLETLDKIRALQPACVILVDYPGFNLRLAKEIKKLNIKVVYYISPKVWAWKQSRVWQIKKYVDQLLVIFKFEQDFYAQFGIVAHYVGNPLLDALVIKKPKALFLRERGLDDYKTTIALLPGSRHNEITTHLPILLKSAALLKKDFPMMQFLLMKAPSTPMALLQEHCHPYSNLNIAIVDNEEYYDGLSAADFAIVASGTATLETGILEKPMVIIYKISWLTYLLAKTFVKIPSYGLINIVAKMEIMPELIQQEARPEKIAQKMKEIFTDENKVAVMKNNLREIRRDLDTGGASARAAEKIAGLLAGN